MTEKEAHLQMCVDQYERGIEAFANAMGKRLCDCRRDEMERKDALLRQALEALETCTGECGNQEFDLLKVDPAIQAVKEALK